MKTLGATSAHIQHHFHPEIKEAGCCGHHHKQPKKMGHGSSSKNCPKSPKSVDGEGAEKKVTAEELKKKKEKMGPDLAKDLHEAFEHGKRAQELARELVESAVDA